MEFIEVTRGDIALANRLAAEILGRTLDELSPHTRKFLLLIHSYVTAQCASAKVARVDLCYVPLYLTAEFPF